jgi:hypothetical protein
LSVDSCQFLVGSSWLLDLRMGLGPLYNSPIYSLAALGSLFFSGLPARKPLACNHPRADVTYIIPASRSTTQKELQNGSIILTLLLNKAKIFSICGGERKWKQKQTSSHRLDTTAVFPRITFWSLWVISSPVTCTVMPAMLLASPE